jgi:hypothetical protein
MVADGGRRRVAGNQNPFGCPTHQFVEDRADRRRKNVNEMHLTRAMYTFHTDADLGKVC